MILVGLFIDRDSIACTAMYMLQYTYLLCIAAKYTLNDITQWHLVYLYAASAVLLVFLLLRLNAVKQVWQNATSFTSS